VDTLFCKGSFPANVQIADYQGLFRIVLEKERWIRNHRIEVSELKIPPKQPKLNPHRTS